MTSYSTFAEFGAAMNPNVSNPMDQSNPLTYCIVPTINAQFIHGATSNNLLYTPQGPGCINYMSERCSIVYDGYCRAYNTLNTDTSWPNMGAIDNLTMGIANSWLKIRPTTGQSMIRNAAERRFLVYPNIVSTSEPFDPNVANSPIVSRYNSSYNSGPVSFKNLDDPVSVDNDLLIDEVKIYWGPCLDVLVKIYKGWKDKNPNIHLYPSKFEQFLREKAPIFEEFLCHLSSIPNYSITQQVGDYNPELQSCYPMLGRGF
jgi:hypothetical protein